jgi:hypothetical protein
VIIKVLCSWFFFTLIWAVIFQLLCPWLLLLCWDYFGFMSMSIAVVLPSFQLYVHETLLHNNAQSSQISKVKPPKRKDFRPQCHRGGRGRGPCKCILSLWLSSQPGREAITTVLPPPVLCFIHSTSTFAITTPSESLYTNMLYKNAF